MGLIIAFRAFFAALFHREVAQRIKLVLTSSDEIPALFCDSEDHCLASTPHVVGKAPDNLVERSEALELLSALQREARFVDFIKEDIAACDDATLGAAARLVQNRCSETIERFFEIRPLVTASEGTTIPVDSPLMSNISRVSVSGVISHSASTYARVVHSGWVAKRLSLPRWTGSQEDSLVIAPAELEYE